MARNLVVGDAVYVPCKLLELEDQPFALYATEVQSAEGRSVTVRLPGGERSRLIGSSRVHKNIGLALIRIGDFSTELTLLNPLAKSILQYCRLLFHDSMVVLQEVRSLEELTRWWNLNHAAFSHVVVIGHGRSDGIRFGVDGWLEATQLTDRLPAAAAHQKTILSLCCQTGYAEFGQQFSKVPMCQAFVGPFHSVHGAIASQFCQTFLAYQFLEGESVLVAFRHARESVPGSASFRLWQDGDLRAGPIS